MSPSPLPVSPEELLVTLDQMGVPHQTVNHPPLFTVEESKAHRGEIPGAHTKNLFLKDKKGRLFLVTAVEDTQIDLKRLHEVIGGSGRVSFGTAEQMMAHLGVTPGSVTAFAAINDREQLVTTILDRRLAEYARINCHPLINTMTTGVSYADLLRFLEGVGHKATILDIGEARDENA
jgi:Ala-tRNA(Pro) deacylase